MNETRNPPDSDLDKLTRLKALSWLSVSELGLLAGTLDQGTLLRLKSLATDFKDGSGDEKLDSVLAEIDLRVAVELAKAGMS